MAKNTSYRLAVEWAGGWNIIPSRSVGDKTPAVKFKQYNLPTARLQTKEERGRYAVIADAEGGVPILLLDHWLSGRSLCVVDVDDMSRWDEVVAWFRERGVSLEDTYQVETGREGGGRHCYFLREHDREHQYRQHIDAKAIGRKAVDLKAGGNYVISPGAIHKTGLVYRGNWPGDLAAIVERLPVMPLSVWREANGNKDGRGFAATPALTVADGPEWASVVAAGNGRQDACPWCGSGSSRVAIYDEAHGTVHCFKEGVTRRLLSATVATPAKAAKVKAEPQPRTPEHLRVVSFTEAHAAYVADLDGDAKDSAQTCISPDTDVEAFLENVTGVGSNMIITVPLDHTSSHNAPVGAEAYCAAAESFRDDYRHMRPCPSGPILNWGTHAIRSSCGNYDCDVCGPKWIAAAKHAGPPILRDLEYDHVATVTVAKDEAPAARRKLERWAGTYLSVSPDPTHERLILLWATGQKPPALAYTVETASAEDVYLREMATVSQPAWAAYPGRRTILRGRRELLGAVILLRDQILGRADLPADVPAEEMAKRAGSAPISVSYIPTQVQGKLIEEELADPFAYEQAKMDPGAASERKATRGSYVKTPAPKWQAKTTATEEKVTTALRKLVAERAIPDVRDRAKPITHEVETESDLTDDFFTRRQA